MIWPSARELANWPTTPVRGTPVNQRPDHYDIAEISPSSISLAPKSADFSGSLITMDYLTPADMLSELHEAETHLILPLRAVHALCDDSDDLGTASLVENWIDQPQRRNWFLFESTRKRGDKSNSNLLITLAGGALLRRTTPQCVPVEQRAVLPLASGPSV